MLSNPRLSGEGGISISRGMLTGSAEQFTVERLNWATDSGSSESPMQ